MPQRIKGFSADVQLFGEMGHLNKTHTIEEVLSEVNDGAKLEVETTLFNDPGEDYSALYLNDKRIGFWPGY